MVASLNINSLLTHLDDLKFFVLDSKIDVLAINETKIDSTVNDIMKYTCQDLRLLEKIALLTDEVAVVFAYIYGVT